jgi:hypothetical protein
LQTHTRSQIPQAARPPELLALVEVDPPLPALDEVAPVELVEVELVELVEVELVDVPLVELVEVELVEVELVELVELELVDVPLVELVELELADVELVDGAPPVPALVIGVLVDVELPPLLVIGVLVAVEPPVAVVVVDVPPAPDGWGRCVQPQMPTSRSAVKTKVQSMNGTRRMASSSQRSAGHAPQYQSWNLPLTWSSASRWSIPS